MQLSTVEERATKMQQLPNRTVITGAVVQWYLQKHDKLGREYVYGHVKY